MFLGGINSYIGNLRLKASQAGGRGGFVEPLYSLTFIAGLLLYGIKGLLFAQALQSMPVSVGYPIVAGVGFSALAIVAALVSGEAIRPAKALRMLLILLDIVVLEWSAGD